MSTLVTWPGACDWLSAKSVVSLLWETTCSSYKVLQCVVTVSSGNYLFFESTMYFLKQSSLWTLDELICLNFIGILKERAIMLFLPLNVQCSMFILECRSFVYFWSVCTGIGDHWIYKGWILQLLWSLHLSGHFGRIYYFGRQATHWAEDYA